MLKGKEKLSKPAVFAIKNGIISCIIILCAIFYIKTDTGSVAGLFGRLLLVFVLPIPAALSIGTLVYMLINKTLKEERKRSLVQHYDRLVDENNDPVHDPEPLRAYMNKWDGQSFFDELQLSGKEKVFELGSGTGRLAIRVAPYCKSLTLLDISPKTLERAKENLSAFSNISYVCSEFLQYESVELFDVIYSSLTMLHIKEKSTALKKVRELLAENGHFVISLDKNQSDTIDTGTMQIKVYPDTPEAFCKTAEEAGLCVTKVLETEFAYVVVGTSIYSVEGV